MHRYRRCCGHGEVYNVGAPEQTQPVVRYMDRHAIAKKRSIYCPMLINALRDLPYKNAIFFAM